MRIKIANVLLLGGAIVAAGAASAAEVSRYDGGDLSGVLACLSLAIFAASAGLLWSAGIFKIHSAEWDQLKKMLGGEYSMAMAGVRGHLNDLPVYARVESPRNNAEYLDRACAPLSSAKHFFALTVTLPYRDEASWRVLYRPKDEDHPQGEWRVVCEESKQMGQKLESAGALDLLSEYDRFTVVKCHAATGELTLRYPAPQRFFCPKIEELEGELALLRRAAEIWQHAAQTQIAA